MSGLKIIVCLLAAFVATALLTRLLLPFLKRLHAGQSIREDGPQSHLAKEGTPTMGGIAIILGVLAGALIFGGLSRDMIVMSLTMLAFAAIGFVDDYVKVVKKRNLGLTAKQKLVLQILIAVLLGIYQSGKGTLVFIPIMKQYADFGLFYVPFVAFVVVAMVNAVNLTDGLDGLASGVTAIVGLFFAFILFAPGTIIHSCFSASLAGACMGFLIYNRHPAKLFMGDTGSLALGGALAAVAIVSNTEFVLPLAGGIYVAEALSVIIQVYVFKTQNGRRFFKMAPLHHHFELSGWPETKVVLVFYAVTAVLCILTAFII